MKEYLAPEFEEVKYDVVDCLGTSGNTIGKENDDIDDFLGDP